MHLLLTYDTVFHMMAGLEAILLVSLIHLPVEAAAHSMAGLKVHGQGTSRGTWLTLTHQNDIYIYTLTNVQLYIYN